MMHALSNKWQNGILALGMAMSLFSCSPEDINPRQEMDASLSSAKKAAPGAETMAASDYTVQAGKPAVSVCGSAQVSKLLSGRDLEQVGTVSSYNDEHNLYVTISLDGNWRIKESQLYAGTPEYTATIKTPAPGQFPFAYNAGTMPVKEITYTIPANTTTSEGALDLMSLESFHLALHADLVELDASGNIIKSEGAWAEGLKFADLININSNNWSMYYSYSWKACNSCDPTYRLATAAFKGSGKNNQGAENKTYDMMFTIDGVSVKVGEAQVKYTALKNDNTREVIVTYTITNEAFKIEAASAHISESTVDVKNTSLFQPKMITSPNSKGKWEVMFTGITKPQFAGLYAKIGGVCK